ncbi:hypothetical protein B9Z55_001010 [Caenorhabditis nigoni]|uniref:Uncharacterized protein n=1 Tax=Caenorhabditis nigoni TaxID=1611254 RepID=A0A2G5VDN6_9PELO|nr:hypothetical protein B9Z55_001010 [Caenorhabditis nigoni]
MFQHPTEFAKRLGRLSKTRNQMQMKTSTIQYQQKEDYDLEAAFCDLLNLAAMTLVMNGRVSFWYPVILEK